MINLASLRARRQEWLAQFRLSRSFERGIVKRLKAEFKAVGSAAGRAYDGSGSVEDAVSAHHTRLTTILVAVYVSVAKAFAKRTRTRVIKSLPVGIEVKMTEDELDDAITNFAKRTAAKKVTAISNTTKRRIHDEIQKGIADGKSRSEIALAIEERTGGVIGSARAELISRTETHSAAQAGSLEGALSLDIPLKKQWLSVEDERTRQDHIDMNETTVEMDEPFSVPVNEGDDGVDIMMFPGDPSGSAANVCNCRCGMIYQTQPDAEG